MAVSCKIPVGSKNGKKCMAVITDHGGIWPQIVGHAQKCGGFTSPQHLREAFPTAKFRVEVRPTA